MKADQIAVILAFAALVGIVIFKVPTSAEKAVQVDEYDGVDTSNVPTQSNASRGPWNLTYNEPWIFAPPIGNFLPQVTQGQQGQVVETGPVVNTYTPCNCG